MFCEIIRAFTKVLMSIMSMSIMSISINVLIAGTRWYDKVEKSTNEAKKRFAPLQDLEKLEGEVFESKHI